MFGLQEWIARLRYLRCSQHPVLSASATIEETSNAMPNLHLVLRNQLTACGVVFTFC